MVAHRIADPRILRLIELWLRAGVPASGEKQETDRGTPQGAGISPLLANIFLHYILDLWTHQWRRRRARGRVVAVRYVDDFVMGFAALSETAQPEKSAHGLVGVRGPDGALPSARSTHHSHLGAGADMTRVTLGKSRVREIRLPGSVRAKAKWLSYSTTIVANQLIAPIGSRRGVKLSRPVGVPTAHRATRDKR
ncbi:reverse transcriptase domain-containing protein [Bradyrhizobium sp. RT5a]|uniref:reverse transcriptase domain-containing protein n=1 Tax=unclassified Bradyrhizobium TaxID=2631580 RepID=UPI003394CBAB